MDEWKKVKLGDICQTNLETYSLSEKWDFVNYLDTGSLTKNVVSEYQEIDLQNDKLPSRARRKISVNDILYSTVRPNQEHYGIVKEVVPNMLVSTGFTVISVNQELADSDFIYYCLTQREVIEHLQAIGEQSTSAYPSIKPTDIENLELFLPSLNEQREIASVLRALDDKIENNRKINHHLEQMAQAIFKSWFVDFEPFGGEMPSKWQTKPADCFFDISIGKTPPRKENWCFSEDSKDVPWISISDMGKEGLFINKTSEYLTREAIDKFNVKVVPQNTILLSFKLTIGRIAITNCKMSTNEAIAHFKLTNKHALEWLYCFLNNINYAELGNTSSIATAINSKIIKSMLITMPDSSSLSKFHKIAAPIFEEIRNNHGEIESLQNLRNILLPKLLSGEIPVNQATK